MFECGLEDINLKAAKRSGFSGSTTSEDETKMHIDRLLSQLSGQGQKLHKKVNNDVLLAMVVMVPRTHIVLYCTVFKVNTPGWYNFMTKT